MTDINTTASDVIKEIAALSAMARGVSFNALVAPEGAIGVPAAVPVAIRHGTTPELINIKPLFDYWRARPERKCGTAKVTTLKAFIDLTNRHKTDDSAIFATTDWRNPSLTTIVDYHPLAGGADNAAHRIVYTFPLSDPWKAWVEGDGKLMTQGDFAAVIEDRIADLTSPSPDHRRELEEMFSTTVATPAELMQLSRGLRINVDSAVRGAVNLQSGESQIAFEESHKDADGKPLRISGLFLLRVAPFAMGDVIIMPVRLRYRVKEGKALWFYQIYRPDLRITERVVADLTEAVATTSLPAYEGAAEA